MQSNISAVEGERIKVVCRVRPAKNATENAMRRYVNIQDTSNVLVSSFPEPKVFSFDFVGGEQTTQEEMFQVVGLPYAQACIEGYNGTILCYGQTGTGKTFTMFGEEAADDINEQSDEFINTNRGIVPRVLEHLWSHIDNYERGLSEDQSISFTCSCSFFEIYQEKVFDLLDPTGSNSPSGLKLRDDVTNGVYVEGCITKIVHSPEDASLILSTGCRNRHIGETKMNKKSSRSHAIFLLTVEAFEQKNSDTKCMRTSRFSMVDLAGSESHKDTYASGKELKEAGQINRSLSMLGNVINGLAAEKGNRDGKFINFRDSKLTFLLRDSLGGNSKTVLVATISFTESSLNETLSTLKFAQRAKMIQTNVFVNEETINALDLQREVKRLQLQLLSCRCSTIRRSVSASNSTLGLASQTTTDIPFITHQYSESCLQLESNNSTSYCYSQDNNDIDDGGTPGYPSISSANEVTTTITTDNSNYNYNEDCASISSTHSSNTNTNTTTASKKKKDILVAVTPPRTSTRASTSTPKSIKDKSGSKSATKRTDKSAMPVAASSRNDSAAASAASNQLLQLRIEYDELLDQSTKQKDTIQSLTRDNQTLQDAYLDLQQQLDILQDKWDEQQKIAESHVEVEAEIEAPKDAPSTTADESTLDTEKLRRLEESNKQLTSLLEYRSLVLESRDAEITALRNSVDNNYKKGKEEGMKLAKLEFEEREQRLLAKVKLADSREEDLKRYMKENLSLSTENKALHSLYEEKKAALAAREDQIAALTSSLDITSNSKQLELESMLTTLSSIQIELMTSRRHDSHSSSLSHITTSSTTGHPVASTFPKPLGLNTTTSPSSNNNNSSSNNSNNNSGWVNSADDENNNNSNNNDQILLLQNEYKEWKDRALDLNITTTRPPATNPQLLLLSSTNSHNSENGDTNDIYSNITNQDDHTTSAAKSSSNHSTVKINTEMNTTDLSGSEPAQISGLLTVIEDAMLAVSHENSRCNSIDET